MRRIVLLIGLLAALGALAAGCGADEAEDDEGASPATTGAAVEQPDPCAKEELSLVNAGGLTIGTDNPAFPPWFEGGTPEGSEWQINDPATGEGFESAVAYAVAEQLGFTEDEVEWTVVPFNQSFRPGPKDFDFDINQISYVEARDRAVDFSDSYYDVNQAVVTLQSSDFAEAGSIEDLQGAKLGAPVGTTSYDYIVENIQPGEDPAVAERRRLRPPEQAGRRGRRRPPDRLLHHGRPGTERDDRGPVPLGGRAGVLRHGLRGGKPASRLRQRGAGRAARGRDARLDPAGVARRQDGRSGPRIASRP